MKSKHSLQRVLLASAAVAALAIAVPSASATHRSRAAVRPPFTVEVMAIGLAGKVLVPATKVVPSATHVSVGGRRYRIARHSPLAALEALAATPAGRHLRLRLKADSFGLLVTGVGGENNPALPDPNGWLYKVNDLEAVAGAAVTVLHRGDRVLFYFTEYKGEYEAQFTLDFGRVPSRVRAGATVHGKLLAYSSTDKAFPAAGASVRLGPDKTQTNAQGEFAITAPARAGTYRLRATLSGDDPAFERVVHVTRR